MRNSAQNLLHNDRGTAKELTELVSETDELIAIFVTMAERTKRRNLEFQRFSFSAFQSFQ
jgi:hypothetical protein